MRSAENILKEEVSKIKDSEQPHYYEDIYDGYATAIYNAINEARKETIKECAEIAKVIYGQPTYNEEERDNFYPVEGVDKESILLLIKELK